MQIVDATPFRGLDDFRLRFVTSCGPTLFGDKSTESMVDDIHLFCLSWRHHVQREWHRQHTHIDFYSSIKLLGRISRSCNSCLVRLAEQSFWLMKWSALRHQSKLVKSRACIQFGACWPILAIVGHKERQVHYLGNGCGETGRPKAPALNRRDPFLGVPCSWCTWLDFNDLPYHLNSQPYQDLIILSSTLGFYQTRAKV